MDAQQSVGVLADSFAVVLGVVAIGAALTTVLGRGLIIKWTLVLARRRTVGRVLTARGVDRKHVKHANRRRVTERVRGLRTWTVASELEWLSATCSTDQRPVTYWGITQSPDEALRREQLNELSRGYAALSGRLRSRILVSASSVDVLHREADLAELVSAKFEQVACLVPTATTNTEPRGGGFAPIIKSDDLHLDLWSDANASPRWPDEIAFSHRHHRLIPDIDTARERAMSAGVGVTALAITTRERALLESRMTSGRFFDGVLPSLADARWEKDGDSGNSRLHLEVQECSYSAVVATHHAGDSGLGRRWAPDAAPAAPAADVLTMSLLLTTSDGWLITTERSASMTPFGGYWFPSANGNLEIGRRHRTGEDVDDLGLLDPVRAMMREAREELGVRLSFADVRCTGLARFSCDEEFGTHLVCFVAPARLTLDGVVERFEYADPVDGADEVGGTLLALPWRDPQRDAVAAFSWAVASRRVSPHLAACLATHVTDDERNLIVQAATAPDDTLPPDARLIELRQVVGKPR